MEIFRSHVSSPEDILVLPTFFLLQNRSVYSLIHWNDLPCWWVHWSIPTYSYEIDLWMVMACFGFVVMATSSALICNMLQPFFLRVCTEIAWLLLGSELTFMFRFDQVKTCRNHKDVYTHTIQSYNIAYIYI